MLQLKNVSFSYGKKKVIQNLNLSLNDGEILAVMGPSGCGKSTLLNLIAGLRKPTTGKILLKEGTTISYAFQEPRLFPWLTVKENIAATQKGSNRNEKQILSALAAVDLWDCADLYPHELSGGMKSRISLARALAHGGNLFLLDEPFASLDEKLRSKLCKTLRKEILARGASAILVTHQYADAKAMADRIIIYKKTPSSSITNN